MSTARTAKITSISGEALQEQVKGLAPDLLQIAPWNARKTVDPVAFDQLVESVKAHGIQVPLLVRPYGTPNGHPLAAQHYEIVCGHRRFDAAVRLGLDWVPAIVRELTDDQAREIGLVDNLQREDVPALEEADAYNELKQRLGTPAAIAARVGKDVAYVARRLQLVSLAELPRLAMAERLIAVDHALLIARLGLDEQDEALRYALRYGDGKKPVADVIAAVLAQKKEGFGFSQPASPHDLKEHIEESVGRKLSCAPWSLADASLLVDVPACDQCPSNTKANDLLFGDLEIDEATCENGGCFKEKTEAFVRIQMRTAAGADAPVRLSWKQSSTKPRMAKDGTGVDARAVLRRGQWTDAKAKSCPNVRTGVTVDWDEGWSSEAKKHKPGQVLSVCIAEKCKAHPKDWEKAASSSKESSKPGESWEVRQAREEKELAAFAEKERPVRRALYDAIAAKLSPFELKRAVIESTRETYAIAVARGWAKENGYHAKVEKLVAGVKASDIDRLLFEVVCGRELEPESFERTRKDKGREKLRALAKIAGIDAAAIEKKAEALTPKLAAPGAKTAATPETAPRGTAKPAAKKSILSPAAKKRIADAQKKRWAQAKKKGGR